VRAAPVTVIGRTRCDVSAREAVRDDRGADRRLVRLADRDVIWFARATGDPSIDARRREVARLLLTLGIGIEVPATTLLSHRRVHRPGFQPCARGFVRPS